jgi:hypothetical protein
MICDGQRGFIFMELFCRLVKCYEHLRSTFKCLFLSKLLDILVILGHTASYKID